MTREEIIQGLYKVDVCQIWEDEVILEAIEALKQEPTDKKFTKADIDAIIKAINKGWELRINEVLDKIRAEIEALPIPFTSAFEMKQGALEILDKYKAESEGEE